MSRQIQAIEQYLRTPLFIRKHRALELTRTGEQLFALASPWMHQLIQLTDNVRYSDQTRPVTITASLGVASLWIVPRLGRFQETHPEIDIHVAANSRILDLAHEGIDLGIRYCRKSQAPSGAVHLFDKQVVPVANRAIAASAFDSPASLLTHVLLEFDERARPWLRWSDWLNAHAFENMQPKGYLYFNQYDQVIRAAIEGHGVALGRLALVAPLLGDGRLVMPADTQVGISEFAYWLVRHEDAPREEVRMLAEWIIEEVRLTADSIAIFRAAQDDAMHRHPVRFDGFTVP